MIGLGLSCAEIRRQRKGATLTRKLQDWQDELKFIVDFMRDLSRQTDPQIAANLYGTRLREGGFILSDGFLAVSRRDLKYPAYRITRSSAWKEQINPWTEKHRLPIFTSGLLGEMVYSNEPAIIENLPERYSPDDPAAEYFRGMKFLLATPQFDDGESINMSVTMTRDPAGMPRERIPMMVMQANLWGRAVLSSVLRRELKAAYDALDHELKTVGHIQRSLLPHSLPAIPGLDLAAHYETSQRTGGDYYDFFPLPHGRWGFIIADVSGHGIPAAVRMAITHAIAHTRPDLSVPPGEMLAYLNAVLEEHYIGRTGSFITALYTTYDPQTRQLTYSLAGHPPPRFVRSNEVSALDGQGRIAAGHRSNRAISRATNDPSAGRSAAFLHGWSIRSLQFDAGTIRNRSDGRGPAGERWRCGIAFESRAGRSAAARRRGTAGG